MDNFEKFSLKLFICIGIGLILGLWKFIELIIWVFNHIKII